MRWEDEHYVKLYTRDSLTWKSWPWQARTVFLHLVRKVDRAGIMECGSFDPSRAAALMLDLPPEVVDPGLSALVASGTVEVGPGVIIIPKFDEAQEAKKSDILRKRDSRQAAKDKARAATQAPVKTESVSRDVTRGHAESQAVTLQTHQTHQPSPDTSEEKPPPSISPGAAFFAWVQTLRLKEGQATERAPHPSKISAWYSEAMSELNGDEERLKRALYGFGADPYWQKQAPPCPFPAFMKRWRDFVPARRNHDAA